MMNQYISARERRSAALRVKYETDLILDGKSCCATSLIPVWSSASASYQIPSSLLRHCVSPEALNHKSSDPEMQGLTAVGWMG
jgi:hypothetical protein